MDKSDAMTAEMKGTVFHRFIPPKYFAQKRALLIFAWKKKRLEIFTFQNLQWSLKSNFKSKKIYNRNYSWTVILNAVCLLCSPALRLLHLQGHKFSKTGRGKRLYTSAITSTICTVTEVLWTPGTHQRQWESPEYLLMCAHRHAETSQESQEVMHYTVLAINIAAMLSSLPGTILPNYSWITLWYTLLRLDVYLAQQGMLCRVAFIKCCKVNQFIYKNKWYDLGHHLAINESKKNSFQGQAVLPLFLLK